ncbi:methyltransferase domain-containing protein [Pseudoroseomonas globiformis]|uniref:Methyltransferase domain-containing protein n=1 Tax=Teichococcus globiformis TaxID=2307229 RepID=A0ABV7G1P9_9PROT
MTLEWLSGDGPRRTCPACGAEGVTCAILQVGRPLPRFRLLGCRVCGAAAFDPPPRPDYAEAAGGGAALAFYLQQGAGLWSIASTLLTLVPYDVEARPRMLEIGCGFGFGLDLARRALGWDVQGHDPSPFAAAGRELLGVPIAPGLFTPDAASPGSQDVVLASEVLEHLHEPASFLATLRGALRPGGVLALTTPDLGAVGPNTPPGLLTPLLSAGYHTVLFTAASLEQALRHAGFTTVAVESRGAQLLARASNGSAAWRDELPADRAAYRAWLEAAVITQPAGSDLHLGLLGRAWREAVHEGHVTEADRLFASLDAALRARFGQGLEGWAGSATATPDTLEELVRRQPVALGPWLLARGLHRLLRGEPRPGLESLFLAASRHAAGLRAALGRIGSDDGDAEDAGWVAGAEAVLCAAARGEAGLSRRLEELGDAPGTDPVASTARAAALRRRVYVELVNAGAFVAATPLGDTAAQALHRAEAGHEALADGELDTLWCRAASVANAPETGDPADALRALRALRGASLRRLAMPNLPPGSAAGLLWPGTGLELELLRRAGRMTEMAALRREALDTLASRPGVPPPPPGFGNAA